MPTLETHYIDKAKPSTAMLELKGVATYREAPQLREALFGAIAESGDDNLVVTLHEIDQIDTAAMAVLVEGLKATRDSGPSLFLLSPSDSVQKVFELAGLQDALTRCYNCFDDLQQAIAS